MKKLIATSTILLAFACTKRTETATDAGAYNPNSSNLTTAPASPTEEANVPAEPTTAPADATNTGANQSNAGTNPVGNTNMRGKTVKDNEGQVVHDEKEKAVREKAAVKSKTQSR